MSERRRAREASEQFDEVDALDDRTIAIDAVEDRTIAVDRPLQPITDETEVVQRRSPVADDTGGSDPLGEDDTVVADRGGWLPEGTVRVGGPAPQAFSGPLGAGLGAASAPVNRFAPPEAGRRAVLGTGAGSTSRYTTRRAVAPAPPVAAVAQAVDATRDHGAVLPSVRRRARRGAIVSLVSAGAALIVAIAGLAVVIPQLLAG